MHMFKDDDIFSEFQLMLNIMSKEFERCTHNPNLYCHGVMGNNRLIVTYCFKKEKVGKAVAIFTNDRMIDGYPTFNMLYAVAPDLRGRGLGNKIVEQAIEEFTHDMRLAKMEPDVGKLYITSFVDINNLISQKLSLKYISRDFTTIKDSQTGKPQYYYKKLVSLR